jgi:outer membrane protein assembly factor BamE (lipoprotein component of BamABCDE complex)
MHIVELQRKLQENRNEINSNTSTNSSRTSSTRYIPRTAAVQKEIIGLLNEGYNAMEVSYILGIPSSQVDG